MRLDLDFLKEPFLQFGQGEAKLPKDGLTKYGPYSLTMGAAHPATVKVGLIGTTDTIKSTRAFLDRCASKVPSGLSDSRLAPAFPGFETTFHSELVTDSIFDVILDGAALDAAVNAEGRAFYQTLNLLSDAIRQAAERDVRPDVIALCLPEEVKAKAGTYQLPPTRKKNQRGHPELSADEAAKAAGQYSLFDLEEPEETLEDRALPDPADLVRRDLRRALKAAALPHRIPIQLLTPPYSMREHAASKTPPPAPGISLLPCSTKPAACPGDSSPRTSTPATSASASTTCAPPHGISSTPASPKPSPATATDSPCAAPQCPGPNAMLTCTSTTTGCSTCSPRS